MDAWALTNKNLSERILETECAKKQSMENLETTNQDLTNMDYNIKLLKKAIEEKNPSKMVAESRLEVENNHQNQLHPLQNIIRCEATVLDRNTAETRLLLNSEKK